AVPLLRRVDRPHGERSFDGSLGAHPWRLRAARRTPRGAAGRSAAPTRYAPGARATRPQRAVEQADRAAVQRVLVPQVARPPARRAADDPPVLAPARHGRPLEPPVRTARVPPVAV